MNFIKSTRRISNFLEATLRILHPLAAAMTLTTSAIAFTAEQHAMVFTHLTHDMHIACAITFFGNLAIIFAIKILRSCSGAGKN